MIQSHSNLSRELTNSMYHINYEQLFSFTKTVLSKVKLDDFSVESVATGLCETSLRGVDSHGIRLLPHYVSSALTGRKNPRPNYKIAKKYPTIGLLDADNAFGHSAGMRAIDECMSLADQFGVGIMGVANSSHPGAMASFGLRAARNGYICLCFTHADALQKSHNGTRAYFGTNPICFTAPRKDAQPFCLDMATSMISWNKVLQARANNQALDHGVAADEQGNPTTDPHQARSLISAGSYKGYGLAAMVDILCGVYTGMAFGRSILAMYKAPMNEPRRLGQFYLVFKADGCVEDNQFLADMMKMAQEVYSEPSANGEPVILPGDREIKVASERLKNGIPLDETTFLALKELSQEYDVEFKLI